MSTPPVPLAACGSAWVTVAMPAMFYRPCPVCAAPMANPFPPSWTFDLIKEGPRTGPVTAYATPHRDDCQAPIATPEPGIAIRTPGKYVSDLTAVVDAGPATPAKRIRG